MFMTCVAEGNQIKASYYHTLINFYLDNEKTLRNRFYASLVHHKTLVSARFMKELNNMENLLDNMYQLFFYSVNRKLDEFLLPGTWDYMRNTKITPQNYVLFKQVSHFIFKALMKHKSEAMKALTDCHSDGYFKHQRLFTTILSEGYAFLFLKQIQEVSYSMMEESALRITLLTENELFPYCLFAVLSPVVEACAFHLNVCKMVEKGLKPRKASILTSSGQTITFDSFSILEKDFRAISLMSKRYRRVQNMHKDLIDEMTQVLNRNISPLSLLKDNLSIISSSGTPNDDIPLQNDEVLMSILKQLTQEEEMTPSSSLNEVTEEALTPWDEIFAEVISDVR
ncbi:predicted protein [Naegleria gruberi]|nr:uncharacterized protein NAEGRDRAFT_76254 [Naegleria gruberi]EFC36074.1 predicted protein [Naegleria gruberi]|eukprot:XP_002668818.1 predicted protein [Naegleria gruberi strain NEG-M]